MPNDWLLNSLRLSPIPFTFCSISSTQPRLVWVGPNLWGGWGSVHTGYFPFTPQIHSHSATLHYAQEAEHIDCVCQAPLPSGFWLGPANGEGQQKTGEREQGGMGHDSLLHRSLEEVTSCLHGHGSYW